MPLIGHFCDLPGMVTSGWPTTRTLSGKRHLNEMFFGQVAVPMRLPNVTITKFMTYGISEGNHIAVCGEPSDLAAYMKVLESPATAEAMAFDGVLRDTVKVFVLDKELEV